MTLVRTSGLFVLLLILVVEADWLRNWRDGYFGKGVTVWKWRRRRVRPIQLDEAGSPFGYVHEGSWAPLLFKPAGERLLVRESWGWTYPAYPIALRGSAKWDRTKEQVEVTARLCYWPTAAALTIAVILPPAPASGVGWVARFCVLLMLSHISVPLELWRFRRLAEALREDEDEVAQ